MRQTLRNLGALPMTLIAVLILVGLMKTLISAREDEVLQEQPLPSVVYVVEAMDEETETAPQRVVEEPERPEPEPEPPEPPDPLEPEPLPETLDLPLDLRPLDLPAVAKPPEPKPKPKPEPKQKVEKKSVSKPTASNKSSSEKTTAKQSAARAKFDRRVIHAPRPKYPSNAKRRQIEGYVTLRFTVTRKGKVSNPQVIAAKPPGVFEREALNAIRRWRFRPQPTDYPGVTQKIRFDLRN